MDPFYVKYPSEPAPESAPKRGIVYSSEGYAMNLPLGAQIKVACEDGKIIYKPIMSLVAGERLVLNTHLPRSSSDESMRAKAWLMGVIIPLDQVRLRQSAMVVTHQVDSMGKIIAQIAKTKCQNNYANLCINSDGAYCLQSPVFEQLFEKFAIDPEKGVTSASCAQLARMTRSQRCAFIAGFVYRARRNADGSHTTPAIAQPLAMFLMSLLLKMKIRTHRTDDGSIVISGRENIAALADIISKYEARETEDVIARTSTDSPIIPGYGSRAPSPVAPAPAPAAAAAPVPSPHFQLMPQAPSADRKSSDYFPEFYKNLDRVMSTRTKVRAPQSTFTELATQTGLFYHLDVNSSAGGNPTVQYLTTPFEKIELIADPTPMCQDVKRPVE